MTQICRPKKINLYCVLISLVYIFCQQICVITLQINWFGGFPYLSYFRLWKKKRKKERKKFHDFLMFTTLISKYKPDSDLATVIDDSSSLPPSVSPRRNDRECSPKIIVIDSPWFRYASDGRHESLESRSRDDIPLAKPGSLLAASAGSFTMLWRINVITRYATLTFLADSRVSW